MALDKALRIGVFSLFACWGQSLSSTSSNSQVFWSGQVKGQARLVEPLPTALHQLFPGEFPSLSAARKACRRRLIFVEGALGSCQTVVYENDALEKRERGASGEFEVNERLVGLLPVVFEDDHMAVVVKPAGMPTHGATSSELNSGTQAKKRRGSSSSSSRATTTVRTALLHVLKPSKATATLTTSETKEEQQQQQQHIRAVNISSGVKGSFAPLRRPTHVHRLDKPTSGLLVAAKTLIALQTLSRAFQDRKVKKRYRAVVIGKLSSPPHTSPQVITNNDHGDADECAGSTATTTANNPLKEEEENQQPLCHPSSSCCRSGDGGDSGGTIDCALGGLSAVTRWKVVGDPVPSLKFGWLTTLDLFPSTGRKHQLRRHCAQVLGCPILGDTRYGGNGGGSGCASDTFLQAEATGNGDNDGDADNGADDDDPDACKQQQQQQQIVGELGHEMPSLLKHYSSTSARTSARTSAWSGSGLFLAAVELSLEHPTTGELLSFEIPEPAKFQARRRRERALHDRNRKDEVADSRL